MICFVVWINVLIHKIIQSIRSFFCFWRYVHYLLPLKKLFDLPIIKAFGINSVIDLDTAVHYEDVVDYFLFDAKPDIKNISQKGGLNKVFDWKILDSWKGKEFFLAGGININNIKSAINDTNAFCIDISSGVEKELGIKDSNMIKEIYTEFKALL